MYDAVALIKLSPGDDMENQNDNLQQLIGQAERSLIKTQPPQPDQDQIANKPIVMLMAIAIAVFVWGWQFWSDRISTEQIRLDLNSLIDQARNEIERERASAGQLPDALNDYTLARVVRYEMLGGDGEKAKYKLTAEIAGVSESWTSN